MKAELALVALLVCSCGGDETTSDQADSRDEESTKCSGETIPDQPPFDHQIGLTFDDGPSLTLTPRVLKILAAHGAKATFFINGKNVKSAAHRTLERHVLAAGHFIGNHTQDHLQLTKVSEQVLRQQIEKTDKVLRTVGANPRYLRFPYGAANCKTKAIAESYGYHVTGWTLYSEDWCFAAGNGHCAESMSKHAMDGHRDDLVGNILAEADSKGGGVLLMHDIHKFTVDHLDKILTTLEQAGYRFVRLSDTSTFPLLNE